MLEVKLLIKKKGFYQSPEALILIYLFIFSLA